MPGRKPLVLLIEDDGALRDNLTEALENEGYACWAESTAADALRRLELGFAAPDAILLDLWIPGMAPVRFISHVKERATWSSAPIVLITAAEEREVPAALGVDGVLQKPFGVPRLLEMLRAALEGRAARGESAEAVDGPPSPS